MPSSTTTPNAYAMSTTTGKREASPEAPPRADQLRPLNLPQLVKVQLDAAGLPAVVTAPCTSALLRLCTSESNEERGAELGSDVTRKAVESIIEIWHVEDEWWRDPISRRCVEVILEGGKHLVLYEDLTTSDWFMQRP